MLLILSGVAGSGKDTIKKELIKRMEERLCLQTESAFLLNPARVEMVM